MAPCTHLGMRRLLCLKEKMDSVASLLRPCLIIKPRSPNDFNGNFSMLELLESQRQGIQATEPRSAAIHVRYLHRYGWERMQWKCEVRVSQARHLVSKQRKRNRDEKSPVAGVYVLLSYDGVHVPTETCHYIESPSWHRIAVFQLNARDCVRGDEASVPEQSLIDVSTPTGDVTTSLNPFATTQQSLNAVAKTQSLNPFASDFVPPRSRSPPPPPPVAPLPLRTSMVLHLRVLSDSLLSKEVLGDVAVDLAPLLESKGDHLAIDRLGHVGNVPRGGLPDQETVAVDTWVALRQRTAELRVQILVTPCSPGGTATSRCTDGARHSRQPAYLKNPRSTRRDLLPLPPAAEASAGTVASRGSNSKTRIEPGTGGDAWPLFDNMARDGIVKTSLDADQRSLDDCLLEVQELYDFSAGGGYRKGRQDEDPGEEKEVGTGRRKVIVPDWPACESDAAQLRRDMQYATLRNLRQSMAWAEKLGSSSALQHILRNPPAFGCLRRGREEPTSATKSSAEPAPHQLVRDLEDLVVHGIPTALQPGPVAVDASSPEEDRMGGAFEGGDQELSFLDDVTTAIPRVEVTRVLGSICCAEYHLQVKRESSHDSWFVVRRYSDFMELYNNLPRSFAAITPPLPPKSWRSLSFFSMTPGFLEERRVALEVALRRLAINAIRADAAVQADLRAFLGFPACPGASWLSGLDAGVVRYLARVPPNIELALPALARAPIPVLSDLRVTMWMVLSGAAHKCSITDAREQYTALVHVKDEAEWCGQGGAAENYALAAVVFETIDDDVNRTNVGDSEERERVRRVLKAFALKNPKTGYCQGMNSVALFLLRTAEGREGMTFWLLDALATDIIPGHWEQLSHISAADAGAVSIRALMGERMPELLEHLDTRGLPPEVLVCDFMMSLGCRALPPTSLLRCFDLLFWEGRDTLQYIALAVLRHAEDKLLDVQGAIATSECLAVCTAAMHDADSLVGMAWAEMDKGIGKPAGNSASDGSPFEESL